MARRPDVPCADCGQLMWSGSTSLPPGRATCRPCRAKHSTRAAMVRDNRTPCVDCGQQAWGQRCRSCANQAKVHARPTIRSADDPRVTRRLREQAAPGMSVGERTRLLAKWKRQGRQCTYCQAVATTIDHVLPLVRGGTNHEGNLTPCCRSCNGSKGGYVVVEWRTGRRLPPMQNPPEWATIRARPRMRKVRWAEPLPMFNVCAACGDAAGPTAEFCSARCAARVGYRRTVGIPDRAPLYGRAA